MKGPNIWERGGDGAGCKMDAGMACRWGKYAEMRIGLAGLVGMGTSSIPVQISNRKTTSE